MLQLGETAHTSVDYYYYEIVKTAGQPCYASVGARRQVSDHLWEGRKADRPPVGRAEGRSVVILQISLFHVLPEASASPFTSPEAVWYIRGWGWRVGGITAQVQLPVHADLSSDL